MGALTTLLGVIAFSLSIALLATIGMPAVMVGLSAAILSCFAMGIGVSEMVDSFTPSPQERDKKTILQFCIKTTDSMKKVKSNNKRSNSNKPRD